MGALDTTTGVFGEGDPLGQVGLGVKYGMTANLTLDFTYNPDFSQIESDRAQVEVNQRFALFFSEQRPFFLEGQETFAAATPTNLVHTRTIVDPRFGAKLTGKIGRTTLGVFMADDEAPGRLDDRADPAFGTTAQSFIGPQPQSCRRPPVHRRHHQPVRPAHAATPHRAPHGVHPFRQPGCG